jgi:hypothetical protein
MDTKPVAPANSGVSTSQPVDPDRLASILRRVQLGDSSVTDEVYWLQMRENFITGRE